MADKEDTNFQSIKPPPWKSTMHFFQSKVLQIGQINSQVLLLDSTFGQTAVTQV